MPNRELSGPASKILILSSLVFQLDTLIYGVMQMKSGVILFYCSFKHRGVSPFYPVLASAYCKGCCKAAAILYLNFRYTVLQSESLSLSS